MLMEHELEVRVRYSETDAMGFLHHANFFNFFEMGRIELLRAQGGSYKEIEEGGLFLVVVKLTCNYHSPARYDDLLRLMTRVAKISAVKIEHTYELYCGTRLVATASSTIACVDREGKIRALPEGIDGKTA